MAEVYTKTEIDSQIETQIESLNTKIDVKLNNIDEKINTFDTQYKSLTKDLQLLRHHLEMYFVKKED